MEFFDRKEEVLEIELTQEGKRLLAKGQFKPYYYEFFDDDILYDTVGCGFVEEQNSSIPRIKETPRIRTQNITYGLETELNKLKQDIAVQNGIESGDIKKYSYNKNHDPLKYPLGLGDYSTNYTPAWNLSMISGLINTGSFSSTYNPEADYYEYIPQIYCTASYVYEVRNDPKNYDSLISSIDDKIVFKSKIYQDDTYYIVREKNNLHISLKEMNATFDKENFDIEIFEVEAVEGQKENLHNLYFLKKVINSEVFFTDSQFITEEKIQPYDVEWYFTVANDGEIAIEQQMENEVKFDPYADANAKESQEPC